MRGSGPVECVSAVTLHTANMARAVRFYEAIGFERLYGGPDSDFTSYAVGTGFLNLQLDSTRTAGPIWGRIVFWVDDVDAMYRRVSTAGYEPSTEPADAAWGERYFHVLDADGHELSFARPL